MGNKREIIATLLGYYLDGWADLIENMGEKIEDIKEAVHKQLIEREMPEINVERVTIREGFLAINSRSYTITTTSPGATTAINISKHGNDLFVSWRSYIKVVLNWQLIGIYVVAALILSLLFWLLRTFIVTYELSRLILGSQQWNLATEALGKWFLYAFVIIACGIVILIVAGRIIKQNERAYLTSNNVVIVVIVALVFSLLVENLSLTLGKEIKQIYNLYKAYKDPIFAPLTFIVSTAFSIFIGILLGAVVVGFVLRRNLLAFILKEPSIFDADDIIAMNLSVHKSMLRALDSAGIDVDKLRLKSVFKSRRGEEIS